MPSPTYPETAAVAPAIQAPGTMIDVNDSGYTPTVHERIELGSTVDGLDRLNRDISRMEASGRFGAGAYGVAYGLDLTNPSGTTGRISAGCATLDGPVVVSDDYDIALVNGTTYVWLDTSGSIQTVLNSTTPPAGIVLYLGNFVQAASVVTVISYSNRVSYFFGQAERRTADFGRPTDTPPASCRIITITQTGTYYWDGAAHRCVDGSVTINFEAKRQTFDVVGTNYRIGVTFSGLGLFSSSAYEASLACDESKVVISENTAHKTTGYCEFTIYIPSDAGSGTYGGQLDLELTLALRGPGWTGTTTANLVGTWDAPSEIL